MATNTGLKFYKFNNHTTSATDIASAKAVEGAIIYVVDTHELWIGGETPKLALQGAGNVSFANNILTVTTYTDAGQATTQTLDFSDVASADATLKVFQNVYNLMGASDNQAGTAKVLDYSNTNYLTNATTLVAADKALDTQVKSLADAIDGMDVSEYEQATIDTTTSQTETTVKIKSIKEENGAISAGTATTDLKLDGVYNASSNKVATQSTVTTAVTKAADSTAEYDTTATEISQSWIDVVDDNEIEQGDDFEDDIDKLDNKIAGLADEVINNERVVNEAVNTMADSIGLENDLTLSLSGDTTNIIANDTTVKSALLDLATAVHNAGSVDDVKINNSSIVSNKIADIAVDGTYNASTNKIATKSTVTGAIQALDTQADVQAVAYTAASGNDGAKLTFKGVSETDGVIAQGSGATELQFAKVATTGAGGDVSYTNTTSHMSATNVQGAIDELDTRIDALEGGFDVIKSTNAANTPAGVVWTDTSTTPATTVTGTLTASADTFHKIYLVPAAGGSAPNSYDEYITTKTTSGEPAVTTYAWERLGTIDVDLTGYAKTVTINGKQYAVTSNTTDVNVGDVITSVTGETAISGGDADLVAVTATTTKTTADGTNATVLASSVKVEEVADGLTKDGTASYTTGHYVIQNGKLVDASTTSTGDTYTISANDGLTKASDVKAYVDSKVDGVVDGLDVAEYAQAEIDTTTSQTDTTITIKGIKEEDGEISGTTTNSDVDIEVNGIYNASTNKIATQSTVTNAINALDGSATIASVSNNVVTIKTGVTEADGIISNTTGTTDIVLEEVAVTGAASDVSYSNTASGMTATTVQAAIDELKSGLCWEAYE